ncbi:MAG: hypothetical protein ACK42I_04940 [Thermomicrobium sp.]
MNQWLLTLLLRAITRLLPTDRRADYLRDWLAEYDAEPYPFLKALSFLPAAYHMRTPFEIRPEDVTRVHPLDRFFLAQGKIIWGFVACTFVSLLFMLLAFGGWTAEHKTWFISSAMFLIYSGGLIRTGWGVDLPWLRMTRCGSFIQLFLVIGSLTVIANEPAQGVSAAALLTVYTVLTWTAYWGVHRPLRKRGLLSR